MVNNYCSNCGTKYGQVQGNKFTCSNCMQVAYLNSKPTASALIVHGNKVLLGRRRLEPQKGKWDIIGGFLEYGETPEAGAKRETKEETGLDIKIEKFLGIFMDKYGPEKVSTLNICYIVSVIGGSPAPADDIEELKWFDAESLPSDLAFKNGEEMLDAWIKQL